MLSSQEFQSQYKHTWLRLVAKAAFEEGTEMTTLSTNFEVAYHAKTAGWATSHEPTLELSVIWVGLQLSPQLIVLA